MPRVLIVSPFFPPSSLAGVHRARLLAKHLPRFGWTPHILTVDPRHYEAPLDAALARLVPSETPITRVDALPRQWCRPLGVGDLGLRAYRSLQRAMRRLAVDPGYDVLMVTMSPYYPALAAASVVRTSGAPLVLDYQDPWVSEVGRRQPWYSKSRMSDRLSRWLEPRAVRQAAHITGVSIETCQQIRRRHPSLPAEAFTALPIGIDPDDFALSQPAAADLEPSPDKAAGDRPLVVSYVGTIWSEVQETLHAVLQAFQQLVADDPSLRRRLRVRFVGTTYGPAASIRPQVLPLAQRYGLADVIEEHPQRVGYLEAFQLLASSDVNLILGSHQPHYSASKLQPCLLAGRPVLAVFHADSDLVALARQTGGVRLVPFDDEQRVGSMVPEIARQLKQLLTEPTAPPTVDLRPLEGSLASTVAGRFAAIFDSLLPTVPQRAEAPAPRPLRAACR